VVITNLAITRGYEPSVTRMVESEATFLGMNRKEVIGAMMRKQTLNTVLSLFLACSFMSFPIANASTLQKCPTDFANPKIVATPKGIAKVFSAYVRIKMHNEIKSIYRTSVYKTAPAWTVGTHTCYYTDKTVESGYAGFLPKGIKSGFETLITLKRQTLSGGNDLFFSYAKVGGKWKVLAAGSGP
jgi:hypothetical protein